MGNLSQLTYLAIANCAKFDDIAFGVLRSLTRLISLDISCTAVTGAAFTALGALTNLEALDASQLELSSGCSAYGFSTISCLVNLRSLNLERARLCFEVYPVLASLTRLLYLDLTGTEFDDDAAATVFPKLTSLLSLSLAGAPISDACMESVVQLVSVQSLMLSMTAVSDHALLALQKRCDKLTDLFVSNSRITRAAAMAFLENRPRTRLHFDFRLLHAS